MSQRDKISFFKFPFILFLASFVILIYLYHSPSGVQYLISNEVPSEEVITPLDKNTYDYIPLYITKSYNLNLNGSKDEKLENNLELQNLVTSGKLFKGEKIRKFPENEILFRGQSSSAFSKSDIEILEKNQKNKHDCHKWGVVTTIFQPPSESVRRFMYRKNWCVVVVGDKGKPSVEVSITIQSATINKRITDY